MGESSSDDKAGVMAILTAFDALKAQGISPVASILNLFLKAKRKRVHRISARIH